MGILHTAYRQAWRRGDRWKTTSAPGAGRIIADRHPCFIRRTVCLH